MEHGGQCRHGGGLARERHGAERGASTFHNEARSGAKGRGVEDGHGGGRCPALEARGCAGRGNMGLGPCVRCCAPAS
jgi:hypothetical protein